MDSHNGKFWESFVENVKMYHKRNEIALMFVFLLCNSFLFIIFAKEIQE